MDKQNHRDILSLAENDVHRRKVYWFQDFDETDDNGLDVPDPYYENNFAAVFNICERGCKGLLKHLM